MSPSISVIIPVRNGGTAFEQCLASLMASTVRPFECVAVDDASSDESAAVARRHGARVVSTMSKRGPAAARNLGVSAASGEILLFLDCDVCVRADTLQRIGVFFAENPKAAALIGGYDDAPVEKNFCSQYRNLMHSFVHQTSNPNAVSFWTGCGAVRKEAFFEIGGFNEHYRYPSMEDVEFGYRLIRAGHEIRLDRDLQVTHLKRWDVIPMLKTDILLRGIPWTRLILRYRNMPNDLNLKWSQRWSVVAAWAVLLVMALGFCDAEGFVSFSPSWLGIALTGVTLLLVALNRSFYRFLIAKRGLSFALAAFPFHLCFHALNGVSFAAGIGLHLCAARPRGLRAKFRNRQVADNG